MLLPRRSRAVGRNRYIAFRRQNACLSKILGTLSPKQKFNTLTSVQYNSTKFSSYGVNKNECILLQSIVRRPIVSVCVCAYKRVQCLQLYEMQCEMFSRTNECEHKGHFGCWVSVYVYMLECVCLKECITPGLKRILK